MLTPFKQGWGSGRFRLDATSKSSAAKCAPMLRPLEVLKLYPPHAGTVASLLDSRAARAPDRECLVFEQRAITYTELRERVGHAAAMLQQRGVRAGDRVGVMSTNHPSTVVLLLALARIGAVMVPVNPDYKAAEAG